MPERGPETDNLFSNMRRLIDTQGIEAIEYPSGHGYMKQDKSIQLNYDLDRARLQPWKGRTPIILWYMAEFGIMLKNWTRPWLKVKPVTKGYRLISLTPRHRQGNTFDWRTVPIHDKTYFIGLPSEWRLFCMEVQFVPYWPTRDMLELAEVVAGADEVFCNQSAVLTLAQGLGVKYYCNFKAGKTNCKLYTPNEHELI